MQKFWWGSLLFVALMFTSCATSTQFGSFNSTNFDPAQRAVDRDRIAQRFSNLQEQKIVPPGVLVSDAIIPPGLRWSNDLLLANHGSRSKVQGNFRIERGLSAILGDAEDLDNIKRMAAASNANFVFLKPYSATVLVPHTSCTTSYYGGYGSYSSGSSHETCTTTMVPTVVVWTVAWTVKLDLVTYNQLDDKITAGGEDTQNVKNGQNLKNLKNQKNTKNLKKVKNSK